MRPAGGGEALEPVREIRAGYDGRLHVWRHLQPHRHHPLARAYPTCFSH